MHANLRRIAILFDENARLFWPMLLVLQLALQLSTDLNVGVKEKRAS